MKKSKNMVIGCCLFFLAVLMGEGYCLLNMKGDYVTAIGVGIVVLIAAYLFIDTLLGYIEKGKADKQEDEIRQPSGPQQDSETEKLQKAVYMIQKRGFEMLEEELENLQDGSRDGMERITGEISNLLKMGIKYDRENTKQIIVNNKKKMDQLTAYLDQFTHETQKSLREIREELGHGQNGRTAGGDMELKEYRLAVEELRQQLAAIADLVRHMEAGGMEIRAVINRLPEWMGNLKVQSAAPAMPYVMPEPVYGTSPNPSAAMSDVPEPLSMPDLAPEPHTDGNVPNLVVNVEDKSEPGLSAETESEAVDSKTEPTVAEMGKAEAAERTEEPIAAEPEIPKAPEREEEQIETVPVMPESAITEPIGTEPVLEPDRQESGDPVGISDTDLQDLLSGLVTDMPEQGEGESAAADEKLAGTGEKEEAVFKPAQKPEASVQLAPAPKPPVPKAPPAPSDPNKPMSPEEIAALIASMGQ